MSSGALELGRWRGFIIIMVPKEISLYHPITTNRRSVRYRIRTLEISHPNLEEALLFGGICLSLNQRPKTTLDDQLFFW